ncbi:MAG: hypothetical protein WAV16_03685 [Candidatus Moraniibacteriota bacterium]
MEGEPKIINNSQERPSLRREEMDYCLNDALDLINNWKKIPESKLTGEEFRALAKENPAEFAKRKENKFRKIYFSNVTATLETIRISSRHSEHMTELWQRLDKINEELRGSVEVSEAQIDSFDQLAQEIVESLKQSK